MSSSASVDFTWKAQAIVYGMREHPKTGKWEPHFGGNFAPRFRGHPWVETAVAEGWARELRGHLVMRVTRLMALGKPCDNIDALMPEKALVEHWQKNARRFREAAEWRAANAEALGKPVKGGSGPRSLGSIVRIDGPGTLTDRSRAMAGDREDVG